MREESEELEVEVTVDARERLTSVMNLARHDQQTRATLQRQGESPLDVWSWQAVFSSNHVGKRRVSAHRISLRVTPTLNCVNLVNEIGEGASAKGPVLMGFGEDARLSELNQITVGRVKIVEDFGSQPHQHGEIVRCVKYYQMPKDPFGVSGGSILGDKALSEQDNSRTKEAEQANSRKQMRKSTRTAAKRKFREQASEATAKEQ